MAAPVDIFRGKVQWVSGTLCVASCGANLWYSNNCGETWERFSQIPLSPWERLLASIKVLRRLLRWDVHHVVQAGANKLIVCGFKRFYEVDLRTGMTLSCGSSVVGSRPLNICSSGNWLYYGEYRSNPERSPIHIWGSENMGKDWHPLHQFRDIRHIHGVFVDPYTGHLWVTTGDTDQESAIWMTNDQFTTLYKVFGNSQQARVVSLLFTEKYVFFGTDTPLDKNHICRMDKERPDVEVLQEVDSSVFWARKVGDYLFFSTVIEPSDVNVSRDACIWGSKDGERWKCVGQYRKDMWPKYFQYGQILFPEGENNTGYLFYTPFATERDQTVQRLNVSELFEA